MKIDGIKTFILFCSMCCLCGIPRIDAWSYKHASDDKGHAVHILIIDPLEHEIRLVRAKEEGWHRETVASLAKRCQATAAVNGGFWKSDGTPAGALKIHTWLALPTHPRAALGWSVTQNSVLIDRILTETCLDHICQQERRVIPLSHATTSKDWEEMEYIVGGTPLLVQEGRLVQDYAIEKIQETFLVRLHARTAVGIRENGEWVLVVVDGFPHAVGMTIQELAEVMLDLGCVQALNLDGGGSATMVIENQVMNCPIGSIQEGEKRVEAVSDAILIF